MLQTNFCGNRSTGSGDVLKFFFTIYGHGGHLGHVTIIMLTNFHFPIPESLGQKKRNMCVSPTLIFPSDPKVFIGIPKNEILSYATYPICVHFLSFCHFPCHICSCIAV